MQLRRAGDEADPPVAEADQVLGGAQAAGPVGGADRWAPPGDGTPAGSTMTTGMPSRRARLQRRLQLEVTKMTPSVDAGAELFEPVLVGPGALRCTAETTVPMPARVGDLLDAADDLHRPRAVEVDEHEVDQPGRRLACWRGRRR